eukprot:CAMPEP_0119378118 /NCGR_PEP_ID=MMETSP1334-20130426/47417_1 /TAXON_ID=127549 /ORGANISM="Calcidiscus leptoporus, Strain RCC1130" /LENGTH=170 /DNA_ID=CAMNT_0007397233 /DNA_START=27 /DNA_END=540 /DNA_ORIENTATION=-
MLPLLTWSLLAWSVPSRPVEACLGRREALAAALVAMPLLTPAPALAALAKKQMSSAEATAAAKAYKLSQPGEETAEFRAAEKQRAARAAGGAVKDESTEDAMKRLGLRTYGDAIKSGDDVAARAAFSARLRGVSDGVRPLGAGDELTSLVAQGGCMLTCGHVPCELRGER